MVAHHAITVKCESQKLNEFEVDGDAQPIVWMAGTFLILLANAKLTAIRAGLENPAYRQLGIVDR